MTIPKIIVRTCKQLEIPEERCTLRKQAHTLKHSLAIAERGSQPLAFMIPIFTCLVNTATRQWRKWMHLLQVNMTYRTHSAWRALNQTPLGSLHCTNRSRYHGVKACWGSDSLHWFRSAGTSRLGRSTPRAGLGCLPPCKPEWRYRLPRARATKLYSTLYRDLEEHYRRKALLYSVHWTRENHHPPV